MIDNVNNVSNIHNINNINNLKNVPKEMNHEEMKKVSDDFESFFMQKILESGLKNTNIAGENSGSDIIKGMYIENISKSSSGSLGISSMLYDFLSRNNK